MKSIVIHGLEAFYLRHPELKGIPVSLNQIKDAEEILHTKFDRDYTFFLTHFGGSYAGYAIHGFLNAPNIGNETVIELTQQARNLSQLQNLFPELDECIVFSDDGAGNPIAIDSGGGIWIFDFDTTKKNKIADSLGKLIEENIPNW